MKKRPFQVHQGEEAARPTRPDKPALYEARYHRRDARHLFAGLSMTDWKVYSTRRSYRGFVNFQAFVQQTGDLLASLASARFIL